MSKFLEELEAKNKEKVRKRLEKIIPECEDAKASYRDSGYDKYYNKMKKLESEIQELEEYLSPGVPLEKQIEETLKSEEYLRKLQSIKNHFFYMEKDGLMITADVIAVKDILRDVPGSWE